MKILIIGGTGLISTYITEQLTQKGESITLFNHGESSYPTPKGVRTIHGDRTDYPAFERQVAEAGLFDVVIDMVGYDPADGQSVIRAFAGKVGHFIFCSTVDVYQKPATRYPYTEAEPYGGLTQYALDKVVIEKDLLAASAKGAFPLTIIRPAYTYGEGRGPLHTFGGRTTFIDRIRRGLPVIVHGDGTSLWVSCHAVDVAAAFTNACGNAAAFGKTYHTAGEEWLPWNVYHQQVAQALGAPEPTLVHITTDFLMAAAPTRGYFAKTNIQFNNIFDNAAASRDLGFRYTIPWVTGVQRMAAWLDARGQVEKAEAEPLDDALLALWQQAGAAAQTWRLKNEQT